MIRYDENGNPQAIASTKQRAEELFQVRASLETSLKDQIPSFCSMKILLVGGLHNLWEPALHAQVGDKDSDGALTEILKSLIS